MEQDLFFRESYDTTNLVCDRGVDKNIGVYMLSWDTNPYYYYGGSIDLIGRRQQHFRSLRNDYHRNFILSRIYFKYGLPNFTILEYCDKSQVDIIEQKYLDYTGGDKNNVNICPTVTGKGRIIRQETRDKLSKSLSNRVVSDETRARISESQKGEKNHQYGKNPSQATRDKMSKSASSRVASNETRAKISESLKGENHYLYGKHLPQATKDKISKKNSGGNSPSAKKVIDLTNGKIYNCAKDVLLDFQINYNTLKAKLNGTIKKNETPYRYLDKMIFKN